MKTDYSFYINGQWQPANDAALLDVINPANGDVLCRVPKATEEHVDAAVAAAKAAFASWSSTSAGYRTELMNRAADLMQEREAELSKAISQSMGCPIGITKDLQVLSAIDAFRQFANMTDYVEHEEVRATFTTVREAIGVCVLINPWNYPLSQLIGKLGAALAVGSTVVAKPAEQTPLQDLILADIFDKAGFPAGVFNVITGVGAEIGFRLSAHPDVAMVSFTGSTATGVKVAEAAAPSVKRVCQELGGKSPLIITADADLPAAVRYGVEDVMLNSGQTCSSLTRMLVHTSQLAEAEQIAKAVALENIMGDPSDINVSMGPLSAFSQQKKVRQYIQTGLNEGASLILGGLGLEAKLLHGAYVAPTIFSNVTADMRIAQEEIFGPVLSIMAYENLDDAIEIANNSEFGLASAVYAKDATDALAIAKKIRAGQCYIQGSYFNCDAPFGGYKCSGNGREWGEEGLREYVELKAIFTA